MIIFAGKNSQFEVQTIPFKNIIGSNTGQIEVYEYYFVLLTKKEHGLNIYINLLKSQFADMFKLDRRLQPTEATDMVEYNWYLNCKDQTQPLWKLSHKHCLELRDRLDAE